MEFVKNNLLLVTVGALLILSFGININQYGQIKKLKSTISYCENEKEELESKVENLESELEDCQGELEDCQSRKRQIQDDLDDAEFDKLLNQ